MTDHVRKRVDSIKWLLELRDEMNEPRSGNILITAQTLFDLTDELERTEREKDAARAELVQIKLKHGNEEGIVSAAYLFQKAEQEARAYMQRQQEAAVPKWISVEERLPEKVGKYIVCTAKKSVYCTRFETYHSGGDFMTDTNTHVTHWMPLPEPPEEG